MPTPAQVAQRKARARNRSLLRRLRKRLDRTWLDVYTEFVGDDAYRAIVKPLEAPVTALQQALDVAYEQVGIAAPTIRPSGLRGPGWYQPASKRKAKPTR